MSGDWKGRLKGTDWTLEGLAACFTQEQWRVKQGEEGSYYLTSPALTACGTEGEAWALVERTVGYINSAAKLLEGYAPVEVEALVRTEPDGRQRSSARAAGASHGGSSARASGEAVRDGKVVDPLPSFAERVVILLDREGSDSPAARALAQWNLPEQSATSLNNILEIIRDAIWGGHPPKKKRREAWEEMARTMAPMLNMREEDLDDELRRCRDSLQDQASVGVLARHGGSAKAVENPMNLGQAGDFVRRVLLAWLQSKC